MIDDKQRLLAAMKAVHGDRLTTVFPRQGHHALDPANASLYPTADITVEHIGDLLGVDGAAWLDRSVSPASSAGRTRSESLSPRADGGAQRTESRAWLCMMCQEPLTSSVTATTTAS